MPGMIFLYLAYFDFSEFHKKLYSHLTFIKHNMKIDIDDIKGMQAYLLGKGLLKADEVITHMEKPGEGNMNYTLRVTTPERSMIVKQANPYVQKYPQIPAPPQRALSEATFYYTVQKTEAIKEIMPQILAVDKVNFIIVLQDLGTGTDTSVIYNRKENLSLEEVKKLCNYLSLLHKEYILSSDNIDELMANRALRKLNHEHIFLYPLLEDNGFDLNTIQEGLSAVALPYKKNDALKEKARLLGENYMKDGCILLHGDFYPGSWMRTADGIKVLDPEFCFYGSAEFDTGVMRAHLMMAEQSADIINAMEANYKPGINYDHSLSLAYTGIELIRRIIGLAQLPLSLSLQEKKAMLEKALILLEIK